MNNLSDLRRAVISLSLIVRAAARDMSHALVRVLNYTVISTISTSTEVTSNLILAVLRCYMMILLTLKISHNIKYHRVDINVMILII